ncbi:MAG TPA: hypothetical protein VFP10_10905, partial [Candidatus Eisenbacteria bacterium]|nr:hypothetical protein [Candidatus Eisenbacteria bacterium]
MVLLAVGVRPSAQQIAPSEDPNQSIVLDHDQACGLLIRSPTLFPIIQPFPRARTRRLRGADR